MPRGVERAIDRNRSAGRFLLTGSANLLLMRQVSQSLAGPFRRARHLVRRGYVCTDLERDLQDLATISSLPDFRRLMQAACLRLGQLLNQTELGRDVALPQPTVHRWLNLLETSCLLVRLSAYAVIEGPDPLLISAAKPGAGLEPSPIVEGEELHQGTVCAWGPRQPIASAIKDPAGSCLQLHHDFPNKILAFSSNVLVDTACQIGEANFLWA
jgi:hypothetical protein